MAATNPALPRTLNFRELRDTVTAAIAAGWEPDLQRVLHQVSRHVQRLETDRDTAGSVRAAASIERLAYLLERDDSALATFSRGYLHSVLCDLDRLISRLSQYDDVMARRREAEGVRGQVLQLVQSEPGLRPGEVGERLDLSPPATTRALRELAEEGRVTLEPHPTDRRGRICFPSRAAV